MTDPQVLRAVLEEIAEDCLGSAPLMALHDAVRAVLELHKPEQGSCDTCSHISPCPTVRVIATALGVDHG